MSKRFTLFILLGSLTLISCGSEKSEQELLNELTNKKNQDLQNFQDRLVVAREEELSKRYSMNDKAPKNFAEILCTPDYKRLFTAEGLKGFKQGTKCSKANLIARLFPTAIGHIVKEKKKSIALFHFNQQGLADQTFVIDEPSLELEHHKIAMSDGERLSTFIFSKKTNTQETLLIRTPSFHYELGRYSAYIKLALNAGLNLVIQENRGTRHSGGEFQFMHEHNIRDAKETLSWIASQTSLNPRTIAFGEGYDALNALAAGLSRHKNLRSVISCSAPWHLMQKSYTFERLKFVWMAQTALNPINFENEIKVLIANQTPLERFDNLLFARNISDYQDFIDSLSAPKKLANYWQTRQSILNSVRTIKVATTHVSGLDNDPTAVGIFNNYNKWRSNNFHRVYLHGGNSGCGDLFSSKNVVDYLKGSNRRPLVSRYFSKVEKQKNLNSLNQYIKYVKIPVEFKKPDLFSIFPSLETLFGVENISALRLTRLNEKIEAKMSFLRRREKLHHVNGPLQYHFFTTSILQSEQTSTPVMVALENNDNEAVAASPFSLKSVDNESKTLKNLQSISSLFKVTRADQFNFTIKNILSTDVLIAPKQLELLQSSAPSYRDVMTIPKTTQEPYTMVPVETL